jgi:hypothetical protein
MSQRTETEVNSVDLRVQNSIRVQVNRFSSPFNGKNIQQMMLEQLYSHVQKKHITNLPHTRHKIQLIMAENSKYKMGQN